MVNDKPLFSSLEMDSRGNHLRDSIGDIDLSFIFNRADLFYYSGIGLDGMIQLDEEITHFVKRNLEFADDISHLPVESMDSFRVFKEIASMKSVSKIGLETDILPYKTVNYIQKAFRNPEIVDISQYLREIRSVKSLKEQELMKRAAKQTDDSFEFIKDKIKPGVSEIELSVLIDGYLRNDGHPGHVQIRSFQHNYTTSAYVMAGSSTSSLNSKFGPVSGKGMNLYHMSGPSRRKIKNNEAVLIDTTGVWEGYTADETITFFLGNPNKKLLDAYEAAKEVHKISDKLLTSGTKANEAYQVMSNLVKELGLINNFMGPKDDIVQFIGHGIGLELDEYPIITPGYNSELIDGQIIALEPKFIFPEISAGVGLEQDYIVRSGRAERITKYQF